jgi:hypothetical protein
VGTQLESQTDLPDISEADIIASIDDQTFASKFANKIRRSKHHQFVIDLAKGRFDKIKQEALYVDENKDGTLREPSAVIDRETADRLIRLANGAIYHTKTTLRYAKAARKRAEPKS